MTVIVPMYGVEKYVGKCAESLLTQTLKDIEILFVDDATKDKSVEVVGKCIKEHPEFQGSVKVIRHEMNKGLPAARNTGLDNAHGEYIFHCDGDDWMDGAALEKMYDLAKKTSSDYVWCDWYLSYENTERVMPQGAYETQDQMLRHGLLGCGMKYNVWNKLVARNLYDQYSIRFPEGHSMGEDMTMIMLGAVAHNVAHCNQPLYHYIRINTGAMTQSLTSRKLDDIKFNVARMEDFVRNGYGDKYDMELNWFKMNVKLPLILEGDRSMRTMWTEMYPESNIAGLSNPNVSWRTRAVEWCASHGLWSAISVYRWLLDNMNRLLFER